MIHFHSVHFLCLYYYRYFGGGGGCGRQAGRQKVQILLPFCVLFIFITKSSLFLRFLAERWNFPVWAARLQVLHSLFLPYVSEYWPKQGKIIFSSCTANCYIYFSSWSVPLLFKFLLYFILPTAKRLFIRRCKTWQSK